MAGSAAQARPRIAWLRYLSVIAALSPAPAAAGAWIAPQGGQEIWTNAFGERDEATVLESSAYLEMPVEDETSFIIAPWVEQDFGFIDRFRAEATVGVKRALFRGDDLTVALQGGALWMSHPTSEACSEGGAELRLLVGSSLPASGGFLNAEAAARALEGGCEEARLDLTAGYRPSDNWLMLGQVFVDAPQEGEESVKVQLSVIRFGDSGRGVQLGFRARVDDGAQEQALVLAFWGEPGN